MSLTLTDLPNRESYDPSSNKGGSTPTRLCIVTISCRTYPGGRRAHPQNSDCPNREQPDVEGDPWQSMLEGSRFLEKSSDVESVFEST